MLKCTCGCILAKVEGRFSNKRQLDYQWVRQVWLYGIEGHLPRDRHDLMQMTGCKETQLNRYFKAWVLERDELNKQRYFQHNREMASDRQQKIHKENVDFLENQMKEIRAELELYPAGSKVHNELMKTYKLVKAEWERDTGIEAVKKAAANAIVLRSDNKVKQELGMLPAPKGQESKPADPKSDTDNVVDAEIIPPEFDTGD